MKKTIKDYNLENKKVIIRVDFNVPMKDGLITDDNRIIESLPTIKYAIDNHAKVILMSHLGRIKTSDDLGKNSLKAVALRLGHLLNKKVIFVNSTKGSELENKIESLKPGDVLLMENTRYEDLDGQKESLNDEELGKYWASLGDIYINDAFGTAHRSHASNVGIASHLPNGVGFLMEKELKLLGDNIDNPKRPLTVILGGAKVSDKIGVIENLVKKADYILIGGGMAFTFLKAKGYQIGRSLLDQDSLDFCVDMLNIYGDKIIVPIDVQEADEIDENARTTFVGVSQMGTNKIGVDIGPKTIELFKKYIMESHTVVWNGPVGMFEISSFETGTKEIATTLAEIDATTIVGGGDTGSAISKYGLKDKITHVSTGGGASLELLEGKKLPGVEIIADK